MSRLSDSSYNKEGQKFWSERIERIFSDLFECFILDKTQHFWVKKLVQDGQETELAARAHIQICEIQRFERPAFPFLLKRLSLKFRMPIWRDRSLFILPEMQPLAILKQFQQSSFLRP